MGQRCGGGKDGCNGGGHFGRSGQWLVTNQFRNISTFNPQGGCASANQLTISPEAVLS